jgi:hypothetical protein
MARLYADDDFPHPVVEALRLLGHDVLTVQEAGRANQQIDDPVVLADAAADQRSVLTHNHTDFRRLHQQGIPHAGIISCTHDPTNPQGLAQRIHDAVTPLSDLANRFVRIVRPHR